MGLYIRPEFKRYMLVVVEMLAGQEVSGGGQRFGHTIRRWDSVEPKDSVPDEANEHDMRDSIKRK